MLVNDSPTQEFQIQRGLRQGDPISPFLFVLAMEGFHVALKRAQMADVFSGISIGDVEISHLLYADDVVVISPWSLGNSSQLIRIFRCFFLTLGLKINLAIGKVYKSY